MSDVVVIGCGISGAATAYELAKAGRSVTIVERYHPAAMASGWTLAGVRQSGRDPRELPLAIAAVRLWEQLDRELDAPTGYTQKGNLRIGVADADIPRLRDIVAQGTAQGLNLSFLPDSAAIRAVAPAISPHVAAASYCPTDGHADPDLTVNAYLRAAGRLGVRTRFGACVQAIETRGGRVSGVRTDKGVLPADVVVLASGVFGNELLVPFGLSVPLAVKCVTVVRTRPAAPLLAQVISVADASNAEAACAGRQQNDGAFRFTSGIEEWTEQLVERAGRPVIAPKAAALAATIGSFGAVVPASLDLGVESFWCGLIDQTPDALPVLDRVDHVAGLFLARGFSGHGFCLGPITGRVMAALVNGETPPLSIAAFALSRFDEAEQVRFDPVTLHG
ncbi:FAD-binding oxidoreductase [Nguyenibacter sp. L1]|uniref:NAD(P)/FAD-dependent oxidoreductase n=1 Tax=Nguyenibacter sp. L1 TaxID=3049350 RepID=UPI002B4639BE|nr:FAD-binding oxidoreductase [Nguyenibacter sp. L1]WRH89758.1 FAD-binding oxidoreductase [Nguyenibacter sp. L1]